MAADERVVQELAYGLIELHRVIGKCLETRAEIGSALREELFGDSIGVQEGTATQQLGSSGVDLFDLLKRERPGGGNGLGMICGPLAPAAVQLFPLHLVELQVARQAA